MIPDKFKNTGKSFLNKITGDVDKSSLSTFCAFPSGVNFSGKDKDECVVLLVRRDLATFIPQYITIVVFLLAPILLFSVLGGFGLSGSSAAAVGIAGSVIFILLAITFAVDTFLKWFYSVNIITDQRVIDVDFSNVLYHKFSEAQLENIEDVTHTVAGILGSIFDFGTVYIQTAGSAREFEFQLIPRPRDVQDVLLDLLEMKQKGDI